MMPVFENDAAEWDHLVRMWELQAALKRALPIHLRFTDKATLFASDEAKTLPKAAHVLWAALQPFLRVEDLRLEEKQREYEQTLAEREARREIKA